MSVDPPSERTDVETASSIARLLRGRGRDTEANRDTEDSLDERLALASTRRALGSEIAPIRLGRFAVTRRLGRGGQGCVYEATDELLGRRVALKIPRYRHDGAHDDLTFEAQALAGVRHPHVVTIFALEWCEGRPVLVMELVDGTPLLAWVAAQRPRLARVLDVIARIGDGLDALHAAGLAHRDVKPANILMDAAGQPRLVDLGLAAFCGADVRAGGTPSYAAPEQLGGAPADPAADQFGLAATLGAVLASGDVIGAAPRAFAPALARARAPSPADRFADIGAFVRALGAGRRRRSVAMIAALVVGAGVVITSTQWGPACPRDPEALARTLGAQRNPLRDHFAAMPSSSAIEAHDVAVRTLDASAQRWAAAVNQVCDGPAGGRWQGPRAQCLDDGAHAFTATVADLATLDVHTASAAPQLAASLASPESCTGAAQGEMPPVVDRAEELAVRRAISVTARRCRYGLTDDCAADYDALAASATAQGIDPCGWRPSLAFERAISAQHDGHIDRVFESLDSVVIDAERCGRDDIKLDAQRLLAEQLALHRGDGDGAGLQLRAAAATLERMGRPTSEAVALLASEATARLALGDPHGAADSAERALVLHTGLRQGSQSERAQLLGLLSAAVYELGDEARAIELQTEALALHEEQLGASHPAVAHDLANLGIGLGRRDPGRARQLLGRAVEIFEQHVDGHALPLAITLAHTSDHDLAAGDIDTARTANDRALALFADVDAAENSFAADALLVRARLHLHDGDIDAALATAEQARTILEHTRGSSDVTTLAAYRDLGDVHAARDDSELASQWHCRAYDGCLAHYGAAHPLLAEFAEGCDTAIDPET